MTHEDTHEGVEELVPLLALDALSPQEELSVRAHIEGCRECSALLREHLETAAGLALLAEPAPPPPALKARLMARIATEPQLTSDAAASVAPGAPVTEAAGAGPPRSRASRLRVVPSSRWRRVIGGLVAACLVLGVVNLVASRRIADQDRQIAEQDQILAEQDQILALISGPPTMTMKPAAEGIRATGRVFVKDGKAAIVLTGLDDTPQGVYEVWVIKGGTPAPLAPVDRVHWQKEKGQAVIVVDKGIEGAEGMAVSLEPSLPSPSATAPKGPVLLKT